MTREEFVIACIRQNGYNLKSFAAAIHMPYNTLRNALVQNRLGNMALNNVIKICRGLGITVAALQTVSQEDCSPQPLVITKNEESLITAYRANPKMQPAINTLLNLHAAE